MKGWSLMIFCLVAVHGFKAQLPDNPKVHKGHWVCAQDSLAAIEIDKGIIISYYDGRAIDTLTYKIVKTNCDSLYRPISNRDDHWYLIWGDFVCFEIDHLAKDHISLIHTAGRFLSYNRTRKSKIR